jgi:hypothetical protein
VKIPTTRSFRVEEFAEQKSWIGKLFGPLNSFFNYVYLALTNGLTFADNVTGFEHTLDFTYQGTSDFPLFLANPLGNQIRAMQLCQAVEAQSYPIGLVIAWDLAADGRIRIYDVARVVSTSVTVSPLTAATRYLIRLRFTP